MPMIRGVHRTSPNLNDNQSRITAWPGIEMRLFIFGTKLFSYRHVCQYDYIASALPQLASWSKFVFFAGPFARELLHVKLIHVPLPVYGWESQELPSQATFASATSNISLMTRNSTLSSLCHSSCISMAVAVSLDFLGLFGKP